MAGYLIDVNLPYYFSIWRGPGYTHVRDLNDEWTAPVIHIRFGNLKMRAFHERISKVWEDVCKLSSQYRLVNVFQDRIEGID